MALSTLVLELFGGGGVVPTEGHGAEELVHGYRCFVGGSLRWRMSRASAASGDGKTGRAGRLSVPGQAAPRLSKPVHGDAGPCRSRVMHGFGSWVTLAKGVQNC